MKKKKTSTKLTFDEMLIDNRNKRKGRKYRKRQQKLLRKLQCPKLICQREKILDDIRNKKQLLLKQLAEETEQRISELLNKDENLAQTLPTPVLLNDDMTTLDTLFHNISI